MIEFITNNWFYLLIVGFMIFQVSRGGGCCGSPADSKDSNGGSCSSGNSNNLPEKDQEAIDEYKWSNTILADGFILFK